MKILIVKTSALGDIVHSLPVLPYLRSVVPDAEIHWLVEAPFKSLLDGHPLLDQVLSVDTKDWRSAGGLTAVSKLLSSLRMLKQQCYDLTLDLQGNTKSGLFSWGSRAPLRFGFDRHQVRETPNLLATNRKVALSPEQLHVSLRAVAVAAAALPGGRWPETAGPLPVQADRQERVDARLASLAVKGLPVVLHYGTTWTTKLWATDHWCELSRQLAARGYSPLLTWGNDAERQAAEQIASAGAGTIWPRGDLFDLLALLKRAALVIGGDTGPIHMAAAVGTPTVSLFRVTDPERNGPRGPMHRCLSVSLDCAGCLRKNCERDSECAAAIPVAAVLSAAEELLAAGKAAGKE